MVWVINMGNNKRIMILQAYLAWPSSMDYFLKNEVHPLHDIVMVLCFGQKKISSFLKVKLVEEYEERHESLAHSKTDSFTIGDFIQIKKK